MSTGNSGSAGVKNLRAMFENKANEQSTSPPSRGRSSPNGSASSGNSRPLSKVRTSFVSVERPGIAGQPPQWGLRRASELENMDGVQEEVLVTSPGLGEILKGSPFETHPVSKKHEEAADLAKTLSSPKIQNRSQGKPKTNGNSDSTASIMNKLQSPDKKKPGATDKETLITTSTARPVKPPPTRINTKAASPVAAMKSPTIAKSPSVTKSPIGKKASPVTKPSPVAQTSPSTSDKTPTTPTRSSAAVPAIKLRGGPAKIKGVMASAEKARQERQVAAAATTAAPAREIKPPSVASKPTAASRERASLAAKDAVPAYPKTTDTTKASSARPVKLPAAVTATTAASAARKEASSHAEPSVSKPAERKITVPQAPKVATASTRASLAKTTSRQSLANGNTNDKPKPRVSNISPATDEGFLARMMRPTASTSSKVHDKGPATEPQGPKRAVTKAKEAVKKPVRKSLNPTRKSEVSKDSSNSVNGTNDASLGSVVEDDGPGPAVDEETGVIEEDGPAGTVVSQQQAEVVS